MTSTNMREGGDITAEDMLEESEGTSEIVEFFKGKNILLTGATGFLGKIVLEKLLRTCNSLNRIYITVRPKKGKEVQKRFEEIFDGPNMDILKRNHPNYKQKVTLLSGDCLLPDIGLDNESKQTLINEINIIIHCAATVRFDQHIRNAAYINVRSVMDLIKMAKQMKNLEAFLHVSTAFSFCTQKDIGEEIYEPPLTGQKLLSLVESLDDKILAEITPTLLGEFPNTYAYTKAISEDVVKTHGKSLPMVVFRPAIVTGSVTEPVAGWIDNLYGATGAFMGAALGLIRSLHAKFDSIAEMVPADYSMNGAIAAIWYTAKCRSENKENQIETKLEDAIGAIENPVYNYVSSAEAPLTWGKFMQLGEKHARQIPSEHQVWYYCFNLRPNRFLHFMALFFLHTIPAYIIDFLAICVGKKPQLVKGYQKINKFLDVISYFAMRTWNFKNDNVQSLWRKMSSTDQKLFPFSLKNFDWDAYFRTYTRGARVYLLKDPIDTIPKGNVKNLKLMTAHYVLVTVLLILLYKFLSIIFRSIF